MIREASSVILLRRDPSGAPGFEVFLLRRRKDASFMASAFVFPGGAADEGEDARTTAARELFEEAGILLAKDDGEAETLEMPTLETLRKQILEGAHAAQLLGRAGLAWSTDSLVPWSHWITPSIDPKRFSARFFVCEIPGGQEPMFDSIETVDQAWVKPLDAIARAGELKLPPPQVRTFWELSHCESIEAVFAAGRKRADEPHPIMPRVKVLDPGEPFTLLLPWDPAYSELGTGDSTPLTYQPAWARGPSRMVLENGKWTHVNGPDSTLVD